MTWISTPDDIDERGLRPPDGTTFEEDGHAYQFKGGPRLSSATEIVRGHGLAPNYSSVDPGVLRAAGQYGRDLHLALAYHWQGDLDRDSLTDELRRDTDAVVRVLEEAACNPVAVEMIVAHPGIGAAGTVDLLCELYPGRELAIVDYKTGAADGADVQLSIYALLLGVQYYAATGENLRPVKLFTLTVKSGVARLNPLEPVGPSETLALIRSWNFIKTRRET